MSNYSGSPSGRAPAYGDRFAETAPVLRVPDVSHEFMQKRMANTVRYNNLHSSGESMLKENPKEEVWRSTKKLVYDYFDNLNSPNHPSKKFKLKIGNFENDKYFGYYGDF